jgi:hypothetical protein
VGSRGHAAGPYAVSWDGFRAWAIERPNRGIASGSLVGTDGGIGQGRFGRMPAGVCARCATAVTSSRAASVASWSECTRSVTDGAFAWARPGAGRVAHAWLRCERIGDRRGDTSAL